MNQTIIYTQIPVCSNCGSDRVWTMGSGANAKVCRTCGHQKKEQKIITGTHDYDCVESIDGIEF